MIEINNYVREIESKDIQIKVTKIIKNTLCPFTLKFTSITL